MLSNYEYRYRIMGGSFISPIQCDVSNSLDNGDGTITITSIPNADIAIGDFQVRVRAIGINPPSAWLSSDTAFIGGDDITFVADNLQHTLEIESIYGDSE